MILNAPAVFRFTAQSRPERHLEAAAALGVDISQSRKEDAGKILADRITWFMRELQVPQGLRELGYSSSDIPALVEGNASAASPSPSFRPRPSAGPEGTRRVI